MKLTQMQSIEVDAAVAHNARTIIDCARGEG